MEAQALAELVELGEAEAYADMFAWPAPGLERRVERLGEAVALMAPALDIPLFNRVLGLGLRAPARPEVLDAALRLYATAGVRALAIQLSPAAGPASLPKWLGERGLVRRDRWAKTWRPAAPPLATGAGPRVVRLSPEQAETFGAIACAAFGMPPVLSPWLAAGVGRPGWAHFLAVDEADRPIAAGALFVRGEVGWLGIGGTLPEARRRGAQGALLAARIAAGQAAGCRWLITETSEDQPEAPNPSYHNMLRAGFQLAYLRPNYQPARP